MHTLLGKVREVLNIELRQICYLAHLAEMAPNEVARNMVLQLIDHELQEAMFWNNVLCAYSNLAVSPGVPGAPPGAGPVGPVTGPQTDLGPAFNMGPDVFPQPGYMYSPEHAAPAGPAASDAKPPNLPPLPFTGLDKKEKE